MRDQRFGNATSGADLGRLSRSCCGLGEAATYPCAPLDSSRRIASLTAYVLYGNRHLSTDRPATFAISGESSGHYGFGFGWGSWALVAVAIASSSSARWRWESLKCWLVGSILSSISPRASAA
jgi:hypothetical protein